MDSFTMQKDLHPLFAPFCNLQSAHTISRLLRREVRISTSVARSQATARTKLEISDSSRASTPEKICLHQFFNLLQLLAGDLPLKRSLKGIYDLQSKDLPMLRRDVHVWFDSAQKTQTGVVAGSKPTLLRLALLAFTCGYPPLHIRICNGGIK